MATTPIYGLRYQELSDTPDGAALGQNLAEDIEAQLQRIDAILATLAPVTAWATYTPTVSGGGTATFSTRTGRWKRIGVKTVIFNAYFVVDSAGSGSTAVTFTLPTAPSRVVRQAFRGHAESPGGILQPVTFTGGSGNTVDRILYVRPGGSPEIANLTGADLTSGRIITISGTYEEA